VLIAHTHTHRVIDVVSVMATIRLGSDVVMWLSGNSNLVYTIIRKRTIFHQLANLATDHTSIAKALAKRSKRAVQSGSGADEQPSMEGSVPASEAEPGTLKATLAATPGEAILSSVCACVCACVHACVRVFNAAAQLSSQSRHTGDACTNVDSRHVPAFRMF